MFPKLQAITLTSGEVIEIADGVTAIVGPNNSGKSLLLSETFRSLSFTKGYASPPARRVVESLAIAESGPIEQLIDWLSTRYTRRMPGTHPSIGDVLQEQFSFPNGNNVPLAQLPQYINREGCFGTLAPIYARHITPGSTRDLANQSGPFNVGIEEPSLPVQRLWASSDLEQHISALVQRAFNVSLSVSRTGGSQITVHLGEITTPVSLPPTADYLKEVQSLPLVQDQGDGIKAFVGMLLAIMTTDYPLLIIDEPETFLHPPQAYLLGQILAEQHDRDGQVVLVTHSADVIRGLTSVRAYADAVSIVRLTRRGTTNHVAQLATGTMRELYDDPLIRYHNILDGLFFHGTVLCEGDSDCIYYRAVLESGDTLDDGTPTAAISLHFTHCGGKARLAKAVRALRSAKVPVVCIVDNDLLQNVREFEDLVDACGGNPDELRALRNDVASAVEVKTEALSAQQLKSLMEELAGLIESKTATTIRPSEANEFARVLRSRSGWRDFKKGGYLLLGGQALTSYRDLDVRLSELGIFMVPVGELERFHAEIPSDNKAEWLRTVLEQKLYEQSDDARKFMMAVIGYIVAQQ